MNNYQKLILFSLLIFSLIGFIKGSFESDKKKNVYGKAGIFNLIGAFVWGDAVVFGIFWCIASVVFILLNNWNLFLLSLSVFWVVRSFGEMIYWFNQQFSTINRNPPEKFWFYKYFHNDSVWFVYQIFWQCILVISIIFSIYLIKITFNE